MSEDIKTVIRMERCSKVYQTGKVEVQALDDVSLAIDKGEFTAIAGPSGSGKSTLLNLISGLDYPTSGKVYLAGKAISEMSGRELSDYRRDHIGFIFQAYNLIPVLSVMENAEYIMLLQGIPSRERKKRILELLEDVGMRGLENRRPPELSGGQQQRVAIVRAMASQPDIILADEPTANLDSATGSALLDMMRELNEKRGMTFVFSTHDEMIMQRARRLVLLRDGKLYSDEWRE